MPSACSPAPIGRRAARAEERTPFRNGRQRLQKHHPSEQTGKHHRRHKLNRHTIRHKANSCFRIRMAFRHRRNFGRVLLRAAHRHRIRCCRLRGLKVHIRTASLLRHKTLRQSRIALFQVLLGRTRLGQFHRQPSSNNDNTKRMY